MAAHVTMDKKQKLELLTDLYEFTMAEAYFQSEMFAPATFSLFIRDYPPHRGYFISAGLESVLDYLEQFHYSQDDLDYLESTGFFSKDFLHFLGNLRFGGDVHAIPEGNLFFRDEPVLEVTAPIIEGQLMESFVINAINLQVTIATKVSRCVHAASGRKVVDFSLRRTQGIDAGLKVARVGYIAGLASTSNVLAGKIYQIPVSGTMAHSFITSFKEEIDAFRAFADAFGNKTVLLIDTYDTVTGAEKAVEVGREMAQRGQELKGVRLDSGDMTQLSKQVRELMDKAGFENVKIFASGGYDEFKIADTLAKGAEIDAFGVGTKMGVSADSPYTDIAYKLVQYDERPVLKLSSGKKTLVAEKQVFRIKNDHHLEKDIIGLRDENIEGEILLKPVMKNGKRLQPPESLDDIRQHLEDEFSKLGEDIKAIENPGQFPVEISPELEKLQKKVVHRVIEKELGES
ncbi:MAG: nicotinate phosphoribosyltransferase [Desulfobacterales bacterium]|jgi:nicotinate phosphoribosyltransferase